MTITLKQLIRACPFKDDIKNGLLGKLETLSDDEKIRLSVACWQSLGQLFKNELDRRRLNLLEEMEKTGKTPTGGEMAEAEARLYLEFAQKLEAAKTEEQIEEVKKQLKEHLPQN